MYLRMILGWKHVIQELEYELSSLDVVCSRYYARDFI